MEKWNVWNETNNILIPMMEGEEFPAFLSDKLQGTISLNMKRGELVTVYTFNKLPMEKIYFLGLGDGSKMKDTFADFSSKNTENLQVWVTEQTAYKASLGLHYGLYSYKKDSSVEYTFSGCMDEVQKGKDMADVINFARRLEDMPSNICTPVYFESQARKVAEQYGAEYTALSNKELEELNAGGILAVNSGSKYPCFLISMKYNGNGDAPYIALIGKGLTYDAGGYSLKRNMIGMKYDMCGAANMLAIMSYVMKRQLKVNVMMVDCVTENMIGSNAYKVDDIVTSMNGKTIEITNTDAEGRVVLIDGITYAQRNGASKLIDMATLTGACEAALGLNYTGAFTNNSEFLAQLQKASDCTNEKMWQLPLDEDFHKEVRKSLVADVTNAQVGKKGGASLAAAFLEEFVENDTPWIHLDIAGSSMMDHGANGVMVETISKMLEMSQE